jgi:hypothetical protein
MDSGERGQGGGEGDETRVDLCLNTDFFTDKAPPNYNFQPFTLQQKVHSRCWKSPLVKTKYTAGPHNTYAFVPPTKVCLNFASPLEIEKGRKDLTLNSGKKKKKCKTSALRVMQSQHFTLIN